MSVCPGRLTSDGTALSVFRVKPTVSSTSIRGRFQGKLASAVSPYSLRPSFPFSDLPHVMVQLDSPCPRLRIIILIALIF